MRPRLVLLVVCIALSGCADPAPTTDPSMAPPPATTDGFTISAPPPPPTTDTLHFLAAPTMVTKIPGGSEPQQTAITYQTGGPTEGATWSYQLGSAATAGGYQATIHVRVAETMIVPPDRQNCVFMLTVTLGGTTIPAVCFPPSGAAIQPGNYELSFASTTQAWELAKGANLEFHLQRNGFSASANPAAFALGGTDDFDSRVRVEGLLEVIK